jgi:uncharacterized membrane protein YhaH (DUF805 family)
MGLIAAVRHNLVKLATVSGRDSRAQFWPYAGVVFVLAMVAMFAAMLPDVLSGIARAQKFAAEHPELTTVEQGPGYYSVSIHGYHPELMPDFGAMTRKLAAVFVLVIALYAAAVARRLHDRGKTGAWGLLPVPFIAFSTFAMLQFFDQNPPDLRWFFAIFLSNLLYVASLVTLIVMLASQGTAGENRYGPDPRI